MTPQEALFDFGRAEAQVRRVPVADGRAPTFTLLHGDCQERLAELPTGSVSAIVTDPPYELAFLGHGWDSQGIAFSVPLWSQCLRVLKPGGHLVAFGGTRTWHRLAVAVEDAGFAIRDSIAWIYGSGFPKSLDISKAIDKTNGHWRGRAGDIIRDNDAMNSPNYERTGKGDPVTDDAKTWQGWGTALKPAHEPIVVARKPFTGTVAANVQAYGTGALNIDGCRIDAAGERFGGGAFASSGFVSGYERGAGYVESSQERWPANAILDESQATTLDEQSGGASRFFYCAKATRSERPVGPDGTKHPTVKPLTLMRWLVRLVTPPGGVVLDPFAGSGTTGEAALLEGRDVTLIERDAGYLPLIEQRMNRVLGGRHD